MSSPLPPWLLRFTGTDMKILIFAMTAISLSLNPILINNDYSIILPVDSSRIIYFLTFYAPIAIYFVLERIRKNQVPTAQGFEWSHYGATLSVIMITICQWVGLYWSSLPDLLLSIFLALLLAIFASNISNCYSPKTFKLKVTDPYVTKRQLWITISYIITGLLIIIHYPLDGPNFIPKGSDEKCPNQWVCLKNMDFWARFLVKCQMQSIVWLSSQVFTETFVVWNAKKLTLEATGEIKPQGLIRQGWNWVPDEDFEEESVETEALIRNL